ncbi:MAG: conjugative transposon protein TraM [Prevotellaceae bacterium]|jgi:conjugative transposon TraM protein|nr:conjugative transposon protein TraM [Prevotellaceae bacterium]
MQSNQKQKIKKYLAYSGIALIGCLLLYLIFSPTDSGNIDFNELNKTLPDPENSEIPEKEKAYIEDDHSMVLSDMFPDLDEEIDLTLKGTKKDSVRMSDTELALERAKQARKNADNTLSGLTNVLTTSSNEREKTEEQAEKIRELEEKLREQEGNLKIAQVQAEMAPYIQAQKNVISTSEGEDATPTAAVMPISVAEINVVSSLNQNSRHGHFYGFDNIATEQKNTIRATTLGQQVVSHGQNLRLRLSEPIQVGQRILPKNSVIVAKCQIDVERLYATVSSIEYLGIVTPMTLDVYDAADGQPGLCLPGSLEQDAMREIGADVATAVGATTQQSISVFSSEPNAAEQIKTDVGRGIISGVSRFAAKKLQEIKVTVQDGHRVFLVISKK